MEKFPPPSLYMQGWAVEGNLTRLSPSLRAVVRKEGKGTYDPGIWKQFGARETLTKAPKNCSLCPSSTILLTKSIVLQSAQISLTTYSYRRAGANGTSLGAEHTHTMCVEHYLHMLPIPNGKHILKDVIFFSCIIHQYASSKWLASLLSTVGIELCSSAPNEPTGSATVYTLHKGDKLSTFTFCCFSPPSLFSFYCSWSWVSTATLRLPGMQVLPGFLMRVFRWHTTSGVCGMEVELVPTKTLLPYHA